MSRWLYGKSYHADRNEQTRYAARKVLGLVLDWHDIRSVVDVGCGVGTWLATAKSLGATNIKGYDGPWVDKAALVIHLDEFRVCDLNIQLPDVERSDLVISLEVAEHLRPERAETLVEDYCRLSDIVLFSAAIPGQGGAGHINERWQSYWAELFDRRGYDALDVLRPYLWGDKNIAWWYRQNMLLYVRRGSQSARALSELSTAPREYLDVVHPEQFNVVNAGLAQRALRQFGRKILGL
ncbi:class I SAM-dependent methyltransferase [Aliiroseovarius subalbicans]|uniref:class I SAM-dependent methyltransferase n=1 Tax=Aliiroseovarius subalbicans TaxID=2925840 RepID=UPI001F56BA83|nr:class I SAM-dependent methyltransferase [Aliiroseovarius subalbicans]MCI2398184.1 class I SAM-dependent methyltransferase [Aliiroseovarius subalbicans]